MLVLSPKHIVWSGPALTSALPTVTVMLSVAVHPFASVTVTLYTVVVLGDTVMLDVVAPVFHAKNTPFVVDAVTVVLSPKHIVWFGPTSTFVLPTVTVIASVAVQPLLSVTVTLYVVVVDGDTLIL